MSNKTAKRGINQWREKTCHRIKGATRWGGAGEPGLGGQLEHPTPATVAPSLPGHLWKIPHSARPSPRPTAGRGPSLGGEPTPEKSCTDPGDSSRVRLGVRSLQGRPTHLPANRGPGQNREPEPRGLLEPPDEELSAPASWRSPLGGVLKVPGRPEGEPLEMILEDGCGFGEGAQGAEAIAYAPEGLCALLLSTASLGCPGRPPQPQPLLQPQSHGSWLKTRTATAVFATPPPEAPAENVPKPHVPRGSEQSMGLCVLAFPAVLWASSAGVWGLVQAWVQGHGKQGRKRSPRGVSEDPGVPCPGLEEGKRLT